MIRFLALVWIFISISLVSFSAIITKQSAERAALNYIKAYYQQKKNSEENILIANTIEKAYNGSIVYYTVVFSNGSFVHIAADDAAYPILGYGTEDRINTEVNAANYNNWMLQYAKAIDEIRTKNLQAGSEIHDMWLSLLNENKSIFFGTKSVSPLLLSKWNQDSPYNAECPVDAMGPGGKVYAGCVAVAMAQIMYYYRYPATGTGSHSYYATDYGTQTANFGNTNYQWNLMQNKMPVGGNFEIAQLLQHLGISVEMMYSAGGSGAFSWDAATALKTNFGYQSSLSYQSKSNYTQTQWNNKIIASIDANIPLYYDGRDSQGNSGHAFNLDGYEGSDHFHFNWGWGGAYNGFYYLSAMNPNGGDFSYNNAAIFDIYPANNYPQYCNATSQTLTALQGTFTDGSGPSNYQSNANCEWLIQPNQGIEKIKLEFDRFSLSTDDTLFIYDGSNNTAPVIAKLTGGILPSDIISSNSSVYLNLVSSASNEDEGFSISYKSIFPVYCNGTKVLNDSIGVLTDGSASNNYNNNTFCKWFIDPANGFPIKLIFDNFDTEQSVDKVKIYDPSTTPSQLLGVFSGNNLPPSIVSPSGKMFITFTSNAQQSYNGWTAHYITGPSVGINSTSKSDSYNIFPNPAHNTINITNSEAKKITDISLYTIDGKIIKSYNTSDFNKTSIIIDINDLPKGIFFVKITDNSGSYNHKIVKL